MTQTLSGEWSSTFLFSSSGVVMYLLYMSDKKLILYMTSMGQQMESSVYCPYSGEATIFRIRGDEMMSKSE